MARGAVPGPRRPRRRVGRAARRLRDHARADGRPRGALHRGLRGARAACSTAPTRAASPTIPRSRRCARTPDPGAQRGDGRHRGAARRAPRRRSAVRLAVDAGAVPRAHRRVPRRGRHRAVRADPPCVGRRPAACTASTTSSTSTAATRRAAAQENGARNELVDAPTATSVVDGLLDAVHRVRGATRSTCGSTCPASHRTTAREQIMRLGDEVLDPLRAALTVEVTPPGNT